MNWGEIKEAVRNYLENEETSFVDNLALFARLAEEEIYRKVQLPATMLTSQSVLIPENRFLAVPSDYISTYSLAIIVDGEHQFLLPKEQHFLREAFPNPTAFGLPRYYAHFDDSSFIVAPTPDALYTVELNYFYKPISISATDDDATTWLSINGESALIFGILTHGYIYMKGDQDVITHYTQKLETAITDLRAIVDGRNRKDTYRTPDVRIPT